MAEVQLWRTAVAQRRQALAHAGELSEIEVGDDRGLGVGGGRQHHPPGIDDHRAAAGAVAGRMLADLVGGDHEALVLDRTGAKQRLPVVAGGREREGGRDREQLGAALGQGAVQLGEADVVTDGHAEGVAAVAERGHDHLVPGLLASRLGVHGPIDLDIEHVELAVGGLDLAVGADVEARVGRLLLPGAVLDERAGDQVDVKLAGDATRPGDSGTVGEMLGVLLDHVGPAEHRPLLRQHHQLGAARGGLTREPVGGPEVAIDVLGRVELNGRCA